MYRTKSSNRMLGFAMSSAIAAAMLAGCTTAGGPLAKAPANKTAPAGDVHTQAVLLAEAAVMAAQRDSAARAALGAAYLDAGRFASAETSFQDAIALGDTTPRTALSLALAQISLGRNEQAAALLNAREDRIPAADLGLALALAGQPERGIHVMSHAIRAGDNNAKIRQNLAYAYALANRWREARLMTEQDVPAGKVGERLEQWAMTAHPDAYQHRVAALLQVPAGVPDMGQPVQLALANTPAPAETAVPALAVTEASELPPLAGLETVELPASTPAQQPAAPQPAQNFQAAFAPSASAPTTVTQDAGRFVPAPPPMLAAVPVSPAAAAERAVPATHLIQLGSFSTQQGARKAWDVYTRKYPELAGHEMVISEALVRGKRYWRVSAAGFGKSASSAMCGKVRARGQGCFAYAEGHPLPGAVDRGIRLARR